MRKRSPRSRSSTRRGIFRRLPRAYPSVVEPRALRAARHRSPRRLRCETAHRLHVGRRTRGRRERPAGSAAAASRRTSCVARRHFDELVAALSLSRRDRAGDGRAVRDLPRWREPSCWHERRGPSGVYRVLHERARSRSGKTQALHTSATLYELDRELLHPNEGAPGFLGAYEVADAAAVVTRHVGFGYSAVRRSGRSTRPRGDFGTGACRADSSAVWVPITPE